MTRISPYIKYLFGLPLFVYGWYSFATSMHLVVHSEASLTRLLIGGGGGMVLGFIGGWIMAPMLTKQIADALVGYLTAYFNIRPGGRRSTDPPATPPPDGEQ